MRIGAVLTWAMMASAATIAQVPQHPAGGTAKVKLAGTVSDAVLKTPIVGAGVKVLDSSSGLTFLKATRTLPPHGTYEIDGLTKGQQYFVMFCSDGYPPDFQVVKVPATVDEQLRQSHSNDPNYSRQDAMQLLAVSGPDPSKFAKTWEEFLKSPASEQEKAKVAHQLSEGIAKKPETLTTAKSFDAYAHADPEKLGKAEESLWSKGYDPSFGSLDPVIVMNMQAHRENLQPAIAAGRGNPSDPCASPYH